LNKVKDEQLNKNARRKKSTLAVPCRPSANMMTRVTIKYVNLKDRNDFVSAHSSIENSSSPGSAAAVAAAVVASYFRNEFSMDIVCRDASEAKETSSLSRLLLQLAALSAITDSSISGGKDSCRVLRGFKHYREMGETVR